MHEFACVLNEILEQGKRRENRSFTVKEVARMGPGGKHGTVCRNHLYHLVPTSF
jgi:hypothetical protein